MEEGVREEPKGVWRERGKEEEPWKMQGKETGMSRRNGEYSATMLHHTE